MNMYQVDAFAPMPFTGNPAAVVPIDEWPAKAIMQAIAQSNNLSETAFIKPSPKGYDIRWFTPGSEVALCGHATLASAYIIYNKLGWQNEKIIFSSLSGKLEVSRSGDLLSMDFPALPYQRTSISPAIEDLVDKPVVEAYESKFDLLLILDKDTDVIEAAPNLLAMSGLDYRGVIITAISEEYDIHSRCFYPGLDVPEDPVTGSAHCVLTPYWCERLNKNKIHAKQGLKRTGELYCEHNQDRVVLSGECRIYLEGKLHI